MMKSGSELMINNANVITGDVEASNGVIHVIDAVLSFSLHNLNIVDVATNAGSFTTLHTAVKEAGLVDFLSGEGPFSEYLSVDYLNELWCVLFFLLFHYI